MKHLLFGLIALTVYIWPAFVQAQATDFAFSDRFMPTVTTAADVVIDTSPVRVSVGDDVIFTQRISAMGNRVRQAGFRIRIFVLDSENSSSPTPAHPAVDGCLVFFSTVYTIPASSNPRIHAISQTDAAWLSVADNQTIANGHYLLVFEQAADADTSPIFRIREGEDVRRYFETGIHLTVRNDGQQKIADVQKLWNERMRHREELAADLVKDNSRLACYRYVRYAVRDGDDEHELLAGIPCSAGLKETLN